MTHTKDYSDMLYMKRPTSSHKKMSMENRAAQFAPFAALSGHDAAIKESARRTEKRIELSEEAKQEISAKLQYIEEHLHENPSLTITYFKKDVRKDGGQYCTITKSIKTIDKVHHTLKFRDSSQIDIYDIIELTSPLLPTF